MSTSRTAADPKRVDVPQHIRRQIDVVVEQFLGENEDENCTSSNNTEEKAATFRLLLEEKLDLEHLDDDSLKELFTSELFTSILDQKSSKNKSKVRRKDNNRQRQLLHQYVLLAWNQQQLAIRVFQFLDSTNKGVVLVEDLQRVAREFIFTENEDGRFVDSEETDLLQEMITIADESGDGLLTQHDIVKIARKVNLQSV